jgi:hypothetical protein
LISIIIGIDPGMSIMAKSTINAANISLKSICIYLNFKGPGLRSYSTTVISFTRCPAPE